MRLAATLLGHAFAAKLTALGSNVSYKLTASSAHTDAVLSCSIETIFAGHPWSYIGVGGGTKGRQARKGGRRPRSATLQASLARIMNGSGHTDGVLVAGMSSCVRCAPVLVSESGGGGAVGRSRGKQAPLTHFLVSSTSETTIPRERRDASEDR